MSGIKACPVCGENEWGGSIVRECLICHTTIRVEFVNERALQWVSTLDRLPEKNGWYCVIVGLNNGTLVYEVVGYSPISGFSAGYEGSILYWLDDRTGLIK